MKEEHRRSTCRRCRRHKREAGRISQAGLCLRCGSTALTENLMQLKAKDGPHYSHWRERILAGVLGPPEG